MVRTAAACLAVLLSSATPAWSAPTDPASDASIDEYFEVSNARALLEGMKQQVGDFIKNSLQQASQGKSITPQRQVILDHMAQQMSDLVSDTLSWDSLKPMYMRVFHDSFTQSEIDGIIRFYKTPAGQAMINKLPLVMQNVMHEMQAMIKPMQQKMIEIQRQAEQQIEATTDN